MADKRKRSNEDEIEQKKRLKKEEKEEEELQAAPTNGEIGKEEKMVKIENLDEDDEPEFQGEQNVVWAVPLSSNDNKRAICPYLDTINRQVLDFDFEKLCSVTLENLNVYACLVCGKYFGGRGSKTQAHYHSLQADHHIFVNLNTYKFYCLPDNYEVVDSSLVDIDHVMNPKFSPDQIKNLDHLEKTNRHTRCLDGSRYLPGFMGLNNIKNNDGMSVVFQALLHVPPLRNFFLSHSNTNGKSPLVLHFGELARKMWSSGRFRPHVSPHEILQAISDASNKKFRIGERCDPMEFLVWFLNKLHADLGGTRKPGSSIVQKVFQGAMNMVVFTKNVVGKKEGAKKVNEVTWTESEKSSNFLFLPLDVPASPLFKNESEKNIIPQMPLLTILEKFNGKNEEMVASSGERRRYLLKTLPKYLIFHIKRFTKNFFFVEKNHTIVHFPVFNLELKDFVDPECLVDNPSTKYNLVANIRHCGDDLKSGNCVVDVQHLSSSQWYEMDDLDVKETLPELIALSESYIQIWERTEASATRSNPSAYRSRPIKTEDDNMNTS